MDRIETDTRTDTYNSGSTFMTEGSGKRKAEFTLDSEFDAETELQIPTQTKFDPLPKNV